MEYNETDRIVEGYGNVSTIDNQGDFVSVTRMSELMPIYMKRGGILMDSHTNRHIGNILHWELRDKDGKDAIYLWAKIFNDYSIDNMVWKAIGNKHYTGFSFGGRSIDKDIKCDEGICFNNIKDLEVWEWSIVPKPANKESTFTKFNEIAKGDRMSTALVPRMENGDIVYDTAEMPMNDGMLNKADTEMEKGRRSEHQTEYFDEPVVTEEAHRDAQRAPSKRELGSNRRQEIEYDLSYETEPKDREPKSGPKDVAAERHYERKYKKLDVEKMDDYQPPGIQEEEKMSDEHTEIEKAGAQSRGPKQTSAKEYGERDSMDHSDFDAEYGRKGSQRTPSRHKLKPQDETSAQLYGSKHGKFDRDENLDFAASAFEESPKAAAKAQRIGKRTDRETEKMDNTHEVAKEDTPMTAPAEDAGNPMNKIISMLESIENRLTDLEGGAPEVEEKAELEDMPMEEEKAETPKKVTVPEPQKQQEDKILNKGEETPERLSDIVGELKKMGYDKVTTPKPSVSAEFPFGSGQTVGDLLNKSETGIVDIHSQLGNLSFKEIDGMFKGE
jgi:hypothetical protein